ncbi:isocitrate lyase/phosphoenolpyruvate mutase family protein [Dactylosporangium fulvum]|uniref:Isocitrate lyase/phosphoenolpyruvate mutase family protein n=1 Tax=Dactylosporangium fulvum TaxID=53359 RepID=A0ABY5W3K1_9ACTN|nr:isocitrate lyase/phosphoenolpyruvate mutase family protein [Dactylosporangium fulvum]UWP84637.1 isocitrate lyase/phosphoenolpyruvate mutase family protein [Dactylosporangium fulvum]
MTPFAALHRPGDPLILPNVWDVASAKVSVRAGFAAVGTTSLGVAASNGLPDGEDLSGPDTVRLVHRLERLGCLVSADLERGSVDLAVTVAAVGGAGVNVEDGMGDAAAHARLIRDVKREVPDLFVNARTDTHWLRTGDLAETLRRLRHYADAGADGVFVPGLTAPADIAAVVAAVPLPLNVLYVPGGLSTADLAGLGVARISLGSLLFRAALAATADIAAAVRSGAAVRADLPGYQEVNG